MIVFPLVMWRISEWNWIYGKGHLNPITCWKTHIRHLRVWSRMVSLNVSYLSCSTCELITKRKKNTVMSVTVKDVILFNFLLYWSNCVCRNLEKECCVYKTTKWNKISKCGIISSHEIKMAQVKKSLTQRPWLYCASVSCLLPKPTSFTFQRRSGGTGA